MTSKLENNSELCDLLIPKWELGCRRITPGEGYLESFLRDNVELTQSPITRIDADSILTADGKTYKVDVGKASPSTHPPNLRGQPEANTANQLFVPPDSTSPIALSTLSLVVTR